MDTVIIVILFILMILYKLFEPRIKGVIGEKIVIKQLNRLDIEEYKILNDIMIKTNNGSTQIDHIVISKFGIFVIETKNYKGWIHGSESSEYWTQSIYKKKVKFRNPIRQNCGHIYALKSLLSEYAEVPYYSIVVFSGSAKLKNVNSETKVIYDYELYRRISDFKGILKLSKRDINIISTKISEANIEDKNINKEHIKQIRNNVHERKQKEQMMICPKCNGTLVRRTGKYGVFYGCSNYPKCRYTLNSGVR